MELTTRAKALVTQGRFGEAADCFSLMPQARPDAATDLLHALVLEITGRPDDACHIAWRALRSKSLSDSGRSLAEYVLSRIAAGRGDVQAEASHLQRAIALGEKADDTARTAWAQLRLIALLAQRSGTDACRALIRSARYNVSCVGDGQLLAALHLIVADVDGKSGLLKKAERHVRLAQSLLERFPNVWLQAWAESALLAISILKCDYPAALEHGGRASALAEQSGAAAITRTVLGNLGQLHFTLGDFSGALEHLNQAICCSVRSGEQFAGIIDSMARVHLAMGNPLESEKLLAGVQAPDDSAGPAAGYVYRHSLITKGEVQARLGKTADSLRCLNEAAELAERSGDLILKDHAAILLDQVLSPTDGPKRDGRSCGKLRPLNRTSPDSIALYERSLACRLVGAGDEAVAVVHRDRAIRIFRTLGDVPNGAESMRAWQAVDLPGSGLRIERTGDPGTLLQTAMTVLMHAGRPELVATELLALLEQLECVTGARAVARSAQGDELLPGAFGSIDDPALCRTFALGDVRNRTLELTVAALPDLESQATLNSVAFLLASIQELDRARIDREERLTLWPVDELPADDDDSVVTGAMRDLMVLARKVAQSTVNVLITGESGTGKEVLARAVHRYSPRAKKPFVPFNCTAVPRELLESQLFGYRRGAFTGADRDNPGLIRAAQDGTLFLDEIGELGLDLQPKLLRFLESGEISPLGETMPLHVNVRIVAATNANLERLVAEGRFREDLYYRLNVVPLPLPPLRERRDEIPALAHHLAARAAAELDKGRVTVGEEIMAHFLVYPWPGNIRQLNNELRRMVAIADADITLTPDSLTRKMREETGPLLRRADGLEMSVALNQGLETTVATLEREMIKVALKTNHGKVEATARALGISRKGLYLKRRRLGL